MHLESQSWLEVSVNRSSDAAVERDFFFENLLVRIHLIIKLILWTGLAQREFKSKHAYIYLNRPRMISARLIFGEASHAWDDNVPKKPRVAPLLSVKTFLRVIIFVKKKHISTECNTSIVSNTSTERAIPSRTRPLLQMTPQLRMIFLPRTLLLLGAM